MTQIGSVGKDVLRLQVAMVILTGLAIFLRFFIRVQRKTSFAADDWWLILSLLCFYAIAGIGIWTGVQGGYDHPLTSFPYPLLEKILKMTYITIPFSVTTTVTAKISILCLYRRIFTTPSFRRNSLVVGLFVVGYWIAAVVGSLLQCIPVQAAYQKLVPGKCIDFAAFFLGLELVNCILDVVMLFLPLQMIQHLHLPTQGKIQLSLIFLLGGLVTIAGIIRMAVIYKAGSAILSIEGDAFWATIENGLAIICACLPTYRPLLTKSKTILLSVSTWYSTLLSKSQGTRGTQSKRSGLSVTPQPSDRQTRNPYSQIEDGTRDNVYLTEAVGGSGAEDDLIAGKDYPLNTITVKHTTEVV